MTNKSTIKISIPNDTTYIDLIFSAIDFMAEKRGFSAKDANKIKLGAEEAIANVINHAYADEESELFDIIISINEIGLNISIKEKGEPFDPSQINEYSADKITADSEIKGLGLFLMRKFMDEVSFHNLGADGKETQLIKYFPYKSLDKYKDFDEKSFTPETAAGKEIAKPEKKQIDFTIRLMNPDEAIEVSKCAYSAYGYSYPNPDIYFPDKVRDYNKTGKMISIVAVTNAANEIMGHTALKPIGSDNVAEVGVSFIKPKFRGGGCFNKLEQARIDEAKKRKFACLFSSAVTTHPFSQKAAHKYGFKDTALMVACIPAPEFKKISGEKRERESLMISFFYLNQPQNKSVYLPEKHAEIIKQIFDNLAYIPEYKKCKPNLKFKLNQSEIETNTDNFGGATITIKKIGIDVFDKIAKLKKALCLDKIAYISLFLDLSDPYSSIAIEKFEQLEFFFCGIFPGADKQHQLVLQFLNNQKINYELIQTDSEMGAVLLNYIKSNDPNKMIK